MIDASIAYKLLYDHFGYTEFRIGQKELILSLMSGRDTVGIMPTGAGKSLCYEIPAISSSGISIVVSPLISLMNNQVHALVNLGIAAAYYNSSLSAAQCNKMLKNMTDGAYKIIYVAPERLKNEEFLSACAAIEISYVIVDEAHCVSEWGQDFRPSYSEIPDFIKRLSKRPVIGAFTATATEKVRDDIIHLLGLNNPLILTTGYDRPNLYFSVINTKSNTDRIKKLKDILDSRKGKSGIIYCSTRKSADELYSLLLKDKYSVTHYHAGLTNDEREKNQSDFIKNNKNIIVATNAFGMGIDKPDIEFVIHHNIPKNIEGYYQEAGRAGRNGENAECIILYMPSDVSIVKSIIDNTQNQTPQKRRAEYMRLNKMVDYVNISGCLRNYILNYFGEAVAAPCGNCSSCTERSKRIKKAKKTLDRS